MKKLKPPHPFPARMAPEIAIKKLNDLTANSVVLDPMAGSGTVLRHAAEVGHVAIGFDTDPLARLMARVWTTPIDTKKVRDLAEQVVKAAKATSINRSRLNWHCSRETEDYVNFWFGSKQSRDLRRLAHRLDIFRRKFRLHDDIANVDCLRLALSKLIITKENGASLARDISHSRPHKVMDQSDFDVFPAFLKAVERLTKELEKHPPPGQVSVRKGDARRLDLPNNSIDCVITSPPYLNAIDYMRGHRLSLVWLGYSLDVLREIRQKSVGTERGIDSAVLLEEFRKILNELGDTNHLPSRYQRMILRYIHDIYTMMSEVRRVLKYGSTATIVVGNSCLKGIFIKNSECVKQAADMVGLALSSECERNIPLQSRYLPPPESGLSPLGKRMRTESILEFVRN